MFDVFIKIQYTVLVIPSSHLIMPELSLKSSIFTLFTGFAVNVLTNTIFNFGLKLIFIYQFLMPFSHTIFSSSSPFSKRFRLAQVVSAIAQSDSSVKNA